MSKVIAQTILGLVFLTAGAVSAFAQTYYLFTSPGTCYSVNGSACTNPTITLTGGTSYQFTFNVTSVFPIEIKTQSNPNGQDYFTLCGVVTGSIATGCFSSTILANPQ